MAGRPNPTVLVIIGVTGDLSRRKLLPAIEKVVAAGESPRQLKVVGISRRSVTASEVLADVSGRTDFLAGNLEMYQMDLTAIEDYKRLEQHLMEVEQKMGSQVQRLFYLSVPPETTQTIIRLLGESGIARTGTTKLLAEKPFGTDLASAQELVAQTREYFDEEQVYRIDHYLAKEMAQNLVVFREGNSLFRRTWSNEFIESIEIIASETIDIEGRAAFYEQTGALRDVVQSHLLQLTALTLAELPPLTDWQDIPRQRLEALRQLHLASNRKDVATRGQYLGYRQAVDNPSSTVETFAAISLLSDDPRWWGSPIVLVTGKALHDKTTEIRLHYHKENANEANALVLRIQPNEGVEVCLWVKEPGFERKLQMQPLQFSYSTYYKHLPDAYERVLVDAIRSDHSLFTTSDEVLETWRLLNPVQKAWAMKTDDLVMYKPGATPEEIMAR